MMYICSVMTELDKKQLNGQIVLSIRDKSLPPIESTLGLLHFHVLLGGRTLPLLNRLLS